MCCELDFVTFLLCLSYETLFAVTTTVSKGHQGQVRVNLTSPAMCFSLHQKTLEKHNSRVLRQMRSLFKYCQGIGHVWDVHEQGLAKTERALQEKLDECRRKHDNENQVRRPI